MRVPPHTQRAARRRSSSMEIMSSGGDDDGRRVGAVPVADKPWPTPAPMEKVRWRRALLVGGLMALLAFFVIGRESASTVLEIASAKLTAMNNGGGFMFMNASHGHHDAGAAAMAADELLGGLLAPGMDRTSCLSRYQMSRYFKNFPYAPSPHLRRKLRAYEARHRRCAPGTPLYAKAVEQLKSGVSAGAGAMECQYIVWLPFDGLGNRMLSMASGFLYALLTGRVLLAAMPPDSAGIFCEPFPNTTWLLPPDFPVDNLLRLGPRPDVSYTRLLTKKKIVVDAAAGDPPASNATAPPVPAYVYLSLGWQMADAPFFCGEHQRALAKVNWLLLYSDLYFAPSLYTIAGFHGELQRLFPAREATSHLLLRYLLHPGNPVWGLVTRYYHSYLSPATRRVGVQIRMAAGDTVPAAEKYNQILACSRQEHNILPETTGDGDDAAAPAMTNDGGAGNGNGTSTAILIASLYGDYYERLRSRYYEHAATGGGGGGGGGGGWVGVFQPTHEERQATEKAAHNRRALAEIYLLSFSEELITSGISTFGYVGSSLAGVRPAILLPAHGHKVPATPCRRAVSMEPCNLTPPRGVTCRPAAKGVDGEDLARHLKVCEDWQKGVKLFD